MGVKRKKRRTHVRPKEDDYINTPKSLVLGSGEVGRSVRRLIADVRKIMEPNTASNLEARKGNKLRDFIHFATHMSVTHLLIFSKTESHVNLRIGRIPRGPTLHFQVQSYVLTGDLLKLLQRPKSPGFEYRYSPLVVLNNFNDDRKETKLMTTVFQNLFPPINVHTIKLTEARRVVLFHLDSESREIEMRHFSIGVKTVGLSKSVKSIVQTNLPNLENFEDVGDYVLRGAYAAESEAEDGESTVTLPQKFVGRNNRKAEQRAIRLTELGPRLQLKLVKIQEGLCDGEVLFHQFETRTKEEIAEMRRKREARIKLKTRRREEQQKNVEKKAGKKRPREGSDDGEDEDDGVSEDEESESS
ncbi:Brix domain-containing protein [Zopfochytrium polystomum]|nr:Brix domain-containing protein [Zopfochytrium polystomum]